MRLRCGAAILFSLLTLTVSKAQYYDTGTDPASLKWFSIKTPRFTLVFPESYRSQAQKFANSLDNSTDRLSAIYPGIKIKLPVIIHNYTTFSNGYVSWAPRRMEIFPTPEQNTIPLDPVEQLTIHETTHVMQMYSLRKGLIKILSFAGGEQVTGAAAIFVPLWFMEGDAVFAESFLSQSGRGRTPAFQKEMKALSTSGKGIYSYDKMIFGSYRDHVPDYYQSGFQVAAWASVKYGHDVWNRALSYTARLPFTIDPFLFSLNKTTGLTKAGVFSQAFDSLGTAWKKDLAVSASRPGKPLYSPATKGYVSYYSPVQAGADSVVAIKTSQVKPPEFVLINTARGSEEHIFTPGSTWPYFISVAKGKIVWVEDRPDPRWENRTFSDIRILDIKSGIARMLSHRQRYLAASLSPDGKKVVAVENSVDNRNRLVIINSSTGEVERYYDTPGNVFAQRPSWSGDCERITFVSLGTGGEGITQLDTRSSEWKVLLPEGRADLGSAIMEGDTLFYGSSESGTDNIMMRLKDGTTAMVTNSLFGAYDPSPAGKSVLFSDYTASGYRICSSDPKDAVNKNPAVVKNTLLVNRMDTTGLNRPGGKDKEYEVSRYRKWEHLFRLHSWMPVYADIDQVQSDPTSIRPGFTLLSQNSLSSLISQAGYEYSGGRNNLHYKLTWKGWYPVFESRLDYGAAPVIYNRDKAPSDPAYINPGLAFTNSVSLPLSFSTGKYSQFVWASLSATYQNNYVYISGSQSYDYGQLQLMPRIYLYNALVRSERDIWPKFGQVLDFSFMTYPFDRNIYGSIVSLRTTFYLPGILRNNGLRLRLNYEDQGKVMLVHYNISDLPRGYEHIISLNYRMLSADYSFPIVYPDLSVPMLVYLKRIRGTMFFDYAEGKGNLYFLEKTNNFHDYNESFRSFGAELLADFYLFRMPFMISGGVQASWKDLGYAPALKFLFRVDVFGMKIGHRL